MSSPKQPGDDDAQPNATYMIDAKEARIGVLGDHARVHGDTHVHNVQNIYRTSPSQSMDEKALDEALKRLEQMPVDEIPKSSNLPPETRIPFVVNPHFVGRVEDLKWLAGILKKGQTAAVGQVAAATGLGGIGKTQLAVEFAHRYGQFFAAGVYWVNFSDPAAIPSEISACCLSGHEGLSLEDRIRWISSEWQSPVPRLLVFDNCEDEALLKEWRPKTGGSRVLVTSRKGLWDETLGIAARPLGVLSRPESIELLKKHRPDMSDDDAAAISEELGDLPLALHLAGSFLKRYRVSPDEYLGQLCDKTLLDHPSLQGRGRTTSPTDHDSHVARTFALSYDRLDPDDSVDRTAISLLSRAACFAPGIPISRELLVKTLRSSAKDSNLDAIDACNRLVDLGLVEKEADESLVLHRLLAHYMSSAVGAKEAQDAVEETLKQEAGLVNESGVPTRLLTWQDHLRWVTDRASLRADESAGYLCNRLGFHLDAVGDYPGALLYWERALAISERVLASDHPNTATSLNNLGHLLRLMGDYQRARQYLERALSMREKTLGPEHLDTASSLNSLGGLYSSTGNYQLARQNYERALAIYEKILGPEHPNTATSLNNLGHLFCLKGDYQGARPYYEQTLEICEKVSGPEHPETATSLNNLGSLLESMGDYERASEYLERALRIREKVLGPNHPDTATTRNNLGSLLRSMGDYQGARKYYEQAVAICETTLGPAHPDTASSKTNLGSLLSEMGDYEGARWYFEQSLAFFEKVLGPEHPNAATVLNNLGFLLNSMGNYQQARHYLERALAIREKILGAEHPDVASTLNNLGYALYSAGDYGGARSYFQRALEILKQVLGSEHPDTQLVIKNLDALDS